MIRIAFTLVMLLALTREAFCGPQPLNAPRLKELVTVTDELVLVGDLIDNAGSAVGIPVFRAPDLGQTGTVKIARVIDALRRHDIAGLETGGLAEVVVTRLSRAITPRDIQDRIAREIAGQSGFGDAGSMLVTLDRTLRTMHIEASVTGEFSVSRMTVEPRTGRFDITLEIPGSAAARRLPLRFTGAVMETVEAATLTRALQRGEIVRASDVVVERKSKTEAAGEALAAEQAVGLATKRSLRPGQVLRSSDLMKPEVVQRNETVTIVYQVPGVMLTVRGKALDVGAVGDMINVLNVQSNRTVQATVAGPGRVTIAATMPLVAATVASINTAPPSAQ
jgi:flagella basal body P-ring formation protein FlgA